MLTTLLNQCRRTVNLCRRSFSNLDVNRNWHDQRCAEAIEEHIARLPSLTVSDQQLLCSLKQQGVAFTSLEALRLPGTVDFLTAASSVQTVLKQKKANLNQDCRSPFLMTASSQLLASHPSLFTWGLQKRLLNLVENYQQLPVAYHGVYLRRDLATPTIARSRLWHTDMEDDHTFKVLIYLHDVNEQGGPFEYLPLAVSQRVQKQLNLKCGYIRTGQVESLIQPHEWKTCTGRAGTVILVDTGMLIHRGKVPQRDRYTAFFDYTSCLPRRPYYCKSSLNPSDLQKVTQNLSQEQRERVFWRASLKSYPKSISENRGFQPLNP